MQTIQSQEQMLKESLENEKEKVKECNEDQMDIISLNYTGTIDFDYLGEGLTHKV